MKKKNGRGLLFNNKKVVTFNNNIDEEVPEQYIRSQIHFIIIELFTLQFSP
jgi:hypothetical protein